MRSEFEKLPEIAERLKGGSIYWNGYQNKYQTDLVNLMSTVCYINGAWFAFQEQQKKLDDAINEISRALSCCESIETECVLVEIKELLK